MLCGMPVPFLDVGLKNTTNIGHSHHLVGMGCVVDVIYGVMGSIKREHPSTKGMGKDVLVKKEINAATCKQ